MSQKPSEEGNKESKPEKPGSITFFCDYLGISRQGYHKHEFRENEKDILRTSLVLYCRWVLENLMPKAGMRELYTLCCGHFKEKMTIGRDQFFNIMRANGIVQRRRKRPRTTNSNHNFYIHPDLLNTTPKLVATRFGQLVVADITYVATSGGWAYLSLLTDAATRAIVGYALHPTLASDGPLLALERAFDFYQRHGATLKDLIHHSDRGVQYCSNEYVGKLKKKEMRISMTQTGDPLHNALAERMNNTIKNGWLYDCEDKTFNEVSALIDKAVDVYNNVRPHQAIGMKTPMEALQMMTEEAA